MTPTITSTKQYNFSLQLVKKSHIFSISPFKSCQQQLSVLSPELFYQRKDGVIPFSRFLIARYPNCSSANNSTILTPILDQVVFSSVIFSRLPFSRLSFSNLISIKYKCNILNYYPTSGQFLLYMAADLNFIPEFILIWSYKYFFEGYM